MGKLLTAVVAPLAAGALLAGCNTSGCTDNRNSLPLAGLYTDKGEQASFTALSVGGIGAPDDSLLVSPAETVSRVYLPLRSTASSTSFFFSFDISPDSIPLVVSDTLTLDYTSTPYFNGEECGASYRYNITAMRHTRHIIDSVALTDREVTNVDREIMKIFIRTAEPAPEPDEP